MHFIDSLAGLRNIKGRLDWFRLVLGRRSWYWEVLVDAPGYSDYYAFLQFRLSRPGELEKIVRERKLDGFRYTRQRRHRANGLDVYEDDAGSRWVRNLIEVEHGGLRIRRVFGGSNGVRDVTETELLRYLAGLPRLALISWSIGADSDRGSRTVARGATADELLAYLTPRSVSRVGAVRALLRYYGEIGAAHVRFPFGRRWAALREQMTQQRIREQLRSRCLSGEILRHAAYGVETPSEQVSPASGHFVMGRRRRHFLVGLAERRVRAPEVGGSSSPARYRVARRLLMVRVRGRSTRLQVGPGWVEVELPLEELSEVHTRVGRTVVEIRFSHPSITFRARFRRSRIEGNLDAAAAIADTLTAASSAVPGVVSATARSDS